MNATIVKGNERPELNVLGHRVWVRLAAEDTGGQFTLVEHISEPGTGIPPHQHGREDETFHIVSGEVDFTVAGKSHLATAGTTVHIPRNVPHTFTVKGYEPARMLIVLTPPGGESMFAALSELKGPPPDMEEVSRVCAEYGVRFL